MWHTSCGVDELTDIDYEEDIKPLQDQKALEDSLDESKEPEPPTMTLTPTTAAACFTQRRCTSPSAGADSGFHSTM
jgi:hypothetical protein